MEYQQKQMVIVLNVQNFIMVLLMVFVLIYALRVMEKKMEFLGFANSVMMMKLFLIINVFNIKVIVIIMEH